MSDLNTSIFLYIYNFSGQSGLLDWVIVFFADYLAYILVAIFLGLFLYKNVSNLEKLILGVSAITGAVIGRGIAVEIIRYFYHHPRPFVTLLQVHPLLLETSYSFPSGHATFFFMLSAVTYRYSKKFGVIFFILSGLMGLARIASGVHYPLDILGGAIIGTLIGLACYFGANAYFRKKKNSHL